jgi:hypothetical protein
MTAPMGVLELWSPPGGGNWAINISHVSSVCTEDDGGSFLSFLLVSGHTHKVKFSNAKERDSAFMLFLRFANDRMARP